ncbi:MAG: hypothetical protein WBQ23_00485 [Bacteroidota bacterium]
MPSFKNPVLFSTEFGVNKATLRQMGVLNPQLRVDTKLFIDPILLCESSHAEMKRAAETFIGFFDRLMRLLLNSDCNSDIAWRTARRLFQGHEIRGTCLGYGSLSTSGTGISSATAAGLLRSAKQIVDLGTREPDLFYVLFLLEPGVGPDAISDLTTNIILSDLSAFSQRVCATLGIETQPFSFRNYPGGTFYFPRNPCAPRLQPVILVPTDVLRDLPIASDWDDVCDAAAYNDDVRNRVNVHVGDIWHETRGKVLAKVKKDIQAYQCIRDALGLVPRTSYDCIGDPAGVISWGDVLDSISSDYPLSLPSRRKDDLPITYLAGTVKRIITQFTFLVEERGLWQTFWYRGTPKGEKAAQLLFFAIAHSYCKANNLDVTPEADTGNGPVDFKFSSGFSGRFLVELKLSKGRVVHGYEKQLEFYKQAEETEDAAFVVIDVGSMGKKDMDIIELKNKRTRDGKKASEIYFIDALPKESASKRN